MAAVIYRINSSKAFSPTMGQALLNVIENLNQSYAQLLLLRAAMIQERDASSGAASDWATMAGVFGFVGSDGATIDNPTAQAAFAAIDTVNTTCTAALQQMCAQFKQQ